MKRRPTALRRIFEADHHLQQLLRRASGFREQTEQARQMLPSDLGAHLSAAIIRDQVLVLFTESSAWATRLRFAAPGLKAAMNGLREVQVRVIPATGKPPTEPRNSRPGARLGQRAAQQIRVMAAVVSDPDLRQTLMRLASLGEDVEY